MEDLETMEFTTNNRGNARKNMAKKKHSKKPLAIMVALFVIIAGAIIAINYSGKKEKSMNITGSNGEISTVYYVECGTFESYVKALNKIVYNDNYALVTSVNPTSIFYKDAEGVEHVQNVDNVDSYVNTMNYLYYNDDNVVEYKLIPHFVMYQKTK